MQAYSDPKRESEPTALPDIEVWEDGVAALTCKCGIYEIPDAQAHDYAMCPSCDSADVIIKTMRKTAWWWWFCFPGCLPEGEPNGPFETEAEALEDAQGE